MSTGDSQGTTISLGLRCSEIRPFVVSAYDKFKAKNFVPGMAVAVVLPEHKFRKGIRPPVHSCLYHFGSANVSTRAAVTNRTQFEIASQTKLFTAAALADALARKKMVLAAPVQSYLPPGTIAPTEPCTSSHQLPLMSVLDLATHRSGLPLNPSGYGADHPGFALGTLYSDLSSVPLLFCPDGGWSYSNFGFGLLGNLVLRADGIHVGSTAMSQGAAFGRLVHRLVIEPLRMTETRLEIPTANRAVPYIGPGAPAPYWNNTGALAPAGGLIASISDMGRFLRANLGTGPKAVVKLLATTHQKVAPGGGSVGMGLAWQIYKLPWYPATYLYKAGGATGMHSDSYLVPSFYIGVTVLTNGPNSPDYAAKLILHALTPNSPTPSPTPTENPGG